MLQFVDMDIEAEIKTFFITKLVQTETEHGNVETVGNHCITEFPAQLQRDNGDVTNPIGQLHSLCEDSETDCKLYNIETLTRVRSSNQDIETEELYNLNCKNLHNGDGELKAETKPYNIKPLARVYSSDQDVEVKEVKPYITESLMQANAVFLNHGADVKLYNTQSPAQFQSENWGITTPNSIGELHNLDVDFKAHTEPYSIKHEKRVQNLYEDVDEEDVKPCPTKCFVVCVEEMASVVPKLDTNENCELKMTCNEIEWETLSNECKSMNSTSMCITRDSVLNGDNLDMYHLDSETNNVSIVQNLQQSNCSRHILTHSKEKNDSSDKSGKKITNSFDEHVLIPLHEKECSCVECGMSFTQKGHLSIHLLNHIGKKKYSGAECDKRRMSRSKRRVIHYAEKKYRCAKCGKKFRQKDYLTKHLLNHLGGKKYSCDECGKSYTRRRGLSKHLLIHSDGKKYICKECGRKFSQRYTLTEHLLIHSGKKKYSCDKCGKLFAQRGGLSTHLLHHSDVEKYNCDECGRTFSRRYALTEHILIHSGKKIYSCDKCGKSFVQKGRLSKHLLIHSGENKYICDECGNKFSCKSKLSRHLLIHAGKKKYTIVLNEGRNIPVRCLH